MNGLGQISIEGNILEAHQDEHGFQASVGRFAKNRGWYTNEREGFPNKGRRTYLQGQMLQADHGGRPAQ